MATWLPSLPLPNPARLAQYDGMRGLIGEATDPAIRALCACAAASVGVWALALAFGFHRAPNAVPEGFAFRTYFEALNWAPYPVFFLLLIPPMWLTWRGLHGAWLDLARTGVLTGPDGERPDRGAQAGLIAAIEQRRWWAAVGGAAVAGLVNALDVAPSWSVYFGAATGTEQLVYACASLDVWTSWVWEALPATVDAPCGDNIGPLRRAEPASSDVAFWLMTYAQQVLLVFFVSLIMCQLLLHTLLFGAFSQLLPGPAAELRIRLNATSPVNEFGLERWNYVLNNFYWLCCPALLMVFLSRGTTDPEDYALGQHMLGIAVPALLLLPMVGTIIARQTCLPDVWAVLDEDGRECYARQQLWPLDRNWSSKLGIILAFTLAALSLGYEVSSLRQVAG